MLRFCDSFLVGISDVSFVDGYGIIGFDDVRVVAIENSGFRYVLHVCNMCKCVEWACLCLWLVLIMSYE